MIRTVAALLAEKPGHPVGKVSVKCSERCGHANRAKFESDHALPFDPDLSTILYTESPEEVAEMCESVSVCSCGCVRRSACETLLGDPSTICLHEKMARFLPVTARLFGWRGEPVEWERVLPHWSCDCGYYPGFSPELDLEHESCPNCGPPGTVRWGATNCPPLTAVVLVGAPDTRNPDDWIVRVRAARSACAEAGVQFVGPGGRLER